MKLAFRAIAASAALAAGIGFAVSAWADAASTQQARSALMKANGAASAALKKAFEAGGTDTAEIQKQAAILAANGSKSIDELFPQGSGPEAVKTRAKPEIWSNLAEFKSTWETFSKTTTALNDAAKKGDMAAAKAAYEENGKACGACHTKFRGPAL